MGRKPSKSRGEESKGNYFVTGILLSSDLMFASRVTSVARRQSRSLTVAKSADETLALANPELKLVLIDLFQFPQQQLAPLIEQLRTRSESLQVVAYGPHVDAAMLEAAQSAGCDRVLTRGQFHQQLPQLLTELL